ncbi:MAG: HD domain-containing protein [Lachnospiraceae bacterium]|nr:HD domain-containing protein [Lachnospiraceae bacterium]
MERQYTRLDEVRNILDPIIKGIEDEEAKRGAFVHLYGVGLMASLLALKRGYSRETAELAEIAGMLHDLLTYVDRSEDTDDHAHKCADHAKEAVLNHLKSFTAEELDMIYSGIYNHSDKNVKGHWFDEIIKDADAVQHALRNPMENYFYEKPRIQQIINELTR